MMKKRYKVLCIYWKTENIHLIKEVGMLPYSLYRYYNCDSFIVLDKKKCYPYLDNETKGLKPIFRNSKLSPAWGLMLSVLKNHRSMDLLITIHPSFQNLFICGLYLTLNKRGRVYVHLDSDGSKPLLEENKIKLLILEKLTFQKNKTDRILWGVQNHILKNKIEGKSPFEHVNYVPDGFYDIDDLEVPYSAKENLIITVGRIGSKQKRTDILLEGFLKVHEFLPSWKLKIIGPIEESFKSYINTYFQQYPQMKNKIQIIGEIRDHKLLYNEYKKAKIFCLTSDYESFGIASVEALSKGCALVISDYQAAYDITDNEKYGNIFKRKDMDDFVHKLYALASDSNRMNFICRKGQEYAYTNYSYKSICKSLFQWIDGKDNL